MKFRTRMKDDLTLEREDTGNPEQPTNYMHSSMLDANSAMFTQGLNEGSLLGGTLAMVMI